MEQQQVEGLGAILDRWECGRDDDLRWLAYALATAKHETAHTMQPIRELGGAAYFHRMYDPTSPDAHRAAKSKREGALPGDGVRFYGRGYVQLTWRTNYRRAGIELGVDLVNEPDLALHPAHAADIMFRGMREGWFTGKKFGDYLNDRGTDWFACRRIINGLDRAADIASMAIRFFDALTLSTRR